MKKVNILIEKSNDHYCAYSENYPGIYAIGETIEDAKEDILKSIELSIKHGSDIPDVLFQNYELFFHFDIPSFLKYYSGIFTKASLERMAGINQKQLGHYLSGYRKPSKKTIEKLDKAIHNLANELSNVHLV